jgi:hypothetical protein
MGVYHIRTVFGNRRSLTVTADTLPQRLPADALADVQMMMLSETISHGIWTHSGEPCGAIMVEVSEGRSHVWGLYWLITDGVAKVAQAALEPAVAAAETVPWPEGIWMTPAATAIAFLEGVIAQHGADLAEEEPEDYIHRLLNQLCEESPWADYLYVRPIDVVGDDEDHDDELNDDADPLVLVAKEVTFMDGSVMYITPRGVSHMFIDEHEITHIRNREWGHAVVTHERH